MVCELFVYDNFISYTAQKQVTLSDYIVHMYVNLWFIKHQVNVLQCGCRIHKIGAQKEKRNAWQKKEGKEERKEWKKEQKEERKKDRKRETSTTESLDKILL